MQAKRYGTAWTNSDIVGSAGDKAPRLQDDFHAAVNHDWFLQAKIPEGESWETSFNERDRVVQHQIEELLACDESKAPKGHEASLSRAFYAAYLDMDARDALGVEPLAGYLGSIEEIDSLDALTEYLAGKGPRPGGRLADVDVSADIKDSVRNIVYIAPDSFLLRDADEYRDLTPQGVRTEAANRAYATTLLERCGRTPEQAAEVYEAACAFERKVAEVSYGTEAESRDDYYELIYNLTDMDGIRKDAGAFPLAGIIDATGYGASFKFVLQEPEWLERVSSVYTEENVPGMKALLEVKGAMSMGSFLDSACYELSQQWNNTVTGSEGSKPLPRQAYNLANALLGMAVGKMYVDKFFSEQTKAEITGLISEVLATYRKRLGAIDWLGAETRSKAIEKLDAMTVRVGYPTSWPDYSQLSFVTGEGDAARQMTLPEMVEAIGDFEEKRGNAKVNQEVDRGEFEMPPQVVNAYYNPSDNSINILAGILGGVFYANDGSIEEHMGGIGMVIGHETTHAFDTTGSQFDKDGNMKNWWTDEDRAAFDERTAKVKAYFSGIEVLDGRCVNGELTKGETVADLGGMSCMVEIAHGKPGFDFARMFEAYARVWRTQEPPQMVEFLLLRDPHAPQHLRTNATVQQLPEFYEAYHVCDGDGMWLPPEERLSVW